MVTLARTSTFRHTTIRIETEHPTQFIDLTDELDALVKDTGVHTGLVNIQGLHTTTAVFVNEHDPLLLSDMIPGQGLVFSDRHPPSRSLETRALPR